MELSEQKAQVVEMQYPGEHGEDGSEQDLQAQNAMLKRELELAKQKAAGAMSKAKKSALGMHYH